MSMKSGFLKKSESNFRAWNGLKLCTNYPFRCEMSAVSDLMSV